MKNSTKYCYDKGRIEGEIRIIYSPIYSIRYIMINVILCSLYYVLQAALTNGKGNIERKIELVMTV